MPWTPRGAPRCSSMYAKAREALYAQQAEGGGDVRAARRIIMGDSNKATANGCIEYLAVLHGLEFKEDGAGGFTLQPWKPAVAES